MATDLGEKFGKWTVIDDNVPRSKWKAKYAKTVLCECSCENKTERLVILSRLKSGETRSCGCSKGANKLNLVGEKFGRWVVIDDNIPKTQWKNNQRKVLCECSCKKKTSRLVNVYSLKGGRTKSCGCLNDEITIKRSITHGLTNHKLFAVWGGLKCRCLNKKSKDYNNYGGRGIKVCDEWLNAFQNFYNWAIENGWEENLQIDRIDNDGNYGPDNCRFVSRSINILNRRLIQTNNTSGYCGVSQYDGDKYKCNLIFNSELILNKYGFKVAKDAAIYRDEFIIKNNLPHKLNFPELDTRKQPQNLKNI